MSTEIIDTSTGVSYLLDAASPRAAAPQNTKKPSQNSNNNHVRHRRQKARGQRAHHHPSKGSKWRGDNVQGKKVDKDGQGFQVS